jgi:hypothetical protein
MEYEDRFSAKEKFFLTLYVCAFAALIGIATWL